MEPENKVPGKGTSIWKPLFSGSMLNFWGVYIETCSLRCLLASQPAEAGLSALTVARQRRVARKKRCGATLWNEWNGGVKNPCQVVVSSIVYFHLENWERFPIWRAYFSNGWEKTHLLAWICHSFGSMVEWGLPGKSESTARPLSWDVEPIPPIWKRCDWFCSLGVLDIGNPKLGPIGIERVWKFCVSGFCKMSGSKLEWLLHFQKSRIRILPMHDMCLYSKTYNIFTHSQVCGMVE